jgi:hypothetical protein
MTAAGPLARLIGFVLHFYRATLRVERVHFDRCLSLKARGVPILYTLWHGRMFLSIQAHRQEGIATMASRSKDGEVIARWLEANGYRVVRGSSSRGGSQALREMVREVRAGRHAALTVDGPRGPARVAQAGAVWLAKATGNPVLPFHLEADRYWTVNSWDRTQIPKPYATVAIAMGEPLHVPRDAGEEGIEAARQELERRLRSLEPRASGLLG